MINNTTSKALRRRIMLRIFRSWLLRSMAPLIVIECIVLFVALFLVARFVFVESVVDNAFMAALGNPFKLAAYFWNSFWKTRLEVQAVIIGFLITVIFLLRHLNRSIIAYVLTRRNQFS